MSKNRVIGRDGTLPWKLPEDLQFFKNTTMGKSVVMGRRTYESIGRPLPGRTNIVLSRKNYRAPGILTAPNLEEAINQVCTLHGDFAQCFVIGGAEAYAQSLPMADKLFCTLIEEEIEGDTFFPEIDLKNGFYSRKNLFKATSDMSIGLSFAHMARIDHGFSNRLTSIF